MAEYVRSFLAHATKGPWAACERARSPPTVRTPRRLYAPPVGGDFIEQLSPVAHLSAGESAVWVFGILPAALLIPAILAAALWWRARLRRNEWHEIGVLQDRFCTPWVRGRPTCGWQAVWEVRGGNCDGCDEEEWEVKERESRCVTTQTSADVPPSADDFSRYEVDRRDGHTLRRYCSSRAALGIANPRPDVRAFLTAPGQSARLAEYLDSSRTEFCTPWVEGRAGCTWHLNFWVRSPLFNGDEQTWEHTVHTHTCAP
jgi:hypothetical protein